MEVCKNEDGTSRKPGESTGVQLIGKGGFVQLYLFGGCKYQVHRCTKGMRILLCSKHNKIGAQYTPFSAKLEQDEFLQSFVQSHNFERVRAHSINESYQGTTTVTTYSLPQLLIISCPTIL